MKRRQPKIPWRVRAYPVQIRVYIDKEPAPGVGVHGPGWSLYSRHRDWGKAMQRAYTEAFNAFAPLGARVEIFDIRTTWWA